MFVIKNVELRSYSIGYALGAIDAILGLGLGILISNLVKKSKTVSD